MHDRRKARELALDVLYQAAIRDELPTEALASQRSQGWSLSPRRLEPGDELAPEVIAYTIALVQGIESRLAEIDALIAGKAQHWRLDRMAIIDKSLLRLAVFELLWRPEVPTAVVVNEAVELAKGFSTEDSGRFVNGILGELIAAFPDRSGSSSAS